VQPRKIKRRVLVALGWNDPRIVRVIGQYAREAGWHLETRQFFTETIPQRWRGEGLIVSNPQRADLLAFIRRQAPLQPTVLISGNNPGIRAPQVTEDNRAAGKLAARHFIEQGHKQFAWFTAYHAQVAADRRDGYSETLAAAGFGCRLLEYRPQRKTVADWLAAQLRDLPRPLACYVLDDQLASETIEVCLSRGWRVPEDIAVMGTGNIEIACECSHAPITSVDLNEEEIGLQAARLLDRLMRGGKPPQKPVIITPRGVVVRQSTEHLALTDPVLQKAVNYITGHLHCPFSLEQVAAAAGVSRRTLYNVFRRDLQLTPAEFVVKTRLEQARQHLASGKKVADTAARCGFGSSRTLTRRFLHHEGVNARTWKQSRARSAHSLDAPS
jgi:LacI family transcriptional regulator